MMTAARVVGPAFFAERVSVGFAAVVLAGAPCATGASAGAGAGPGLGAPGAAGGGAAGAASATGPAEGVFAMTDGAAGKAEAPHPVCTATRERTKAKVWSLRIIMGVDVKTRRPGGPY